MKKIAIVQSNYIPWKGYFDLIAAVDEFILFDDMQYTKRDWRNRNQIKTPQGLHWLTVPVKVKGKYYQTIFETQIEGSDWASAHWKSIQQNYRRAPFFDEISPWLEELYMRPWTQLSELNRAFLERICLYLGITTHISSSSNYTLVDGKTERLADLCVQANATEYVSGPSAKGYVEANVFRDRGVQLSWFDYSGYPEYPQLWGEFSHNVTILDVLFNCGNATPNYMKFIRP